MFFVPCWGRPARILGVGRSVRLSSLGFFCIGFGFLWIRGGPCPAAAVSSALPGPRQVYSVGSGRCSKRFSGLAFPWKVAPFSSPRFSFSEKPSRDFLETDVVRWISYRCDATSCSSVCGKVHQKDSEYSVRAFRLQVFFARSVANASAFSWRMQAASESQSAGNDWQLRECWKLTFYFFSLFTYVYIFFYFT